MKELVELAARVADLERRFAGKIRHGTVEEVDPKKQIMRLNMGTDVEGKPFLSPWIPYAQTAGAFKWHNPPSKGQQMTVHAPTGDWMQATVSPMHWSDANPSPSQKGDEHVMTFGSCTVTVKSGSIEIKVGGSSILVEGSKITVNSAEVHVTGEKLRHNALDVGDTHTHRDVVPGAGDTGIPNP
jgi:phage baseplate assembly protein gpV